MILDLTNMDSSESEIFNKVVLRESRKFNQFITELSELDDKQLAWSLSSFNSRDIHLSKLFLRLCQISFLSEIQKQEKVDTVITDDKLLRNILIKSVPVTKFKIKLKNRNIFPKYLSEVFYSNLSSIVFLVRLNWYLWVYPKKEVRHRSQNITLIDTFLFDTSFSENGASYKDRYYVDCLVYLTEDQKKNIYYCPNIYSIGSGDFFKTLRTSDTNFILKEDYLKFFDYIKAFWLSLWAVFLVIKNKKRIPKWNNVDISNLILNDAICAVGNYSLITAFLNYLFMKRLKDSGEINLRLLVDWNENQLQDKGLIQGTRKNFPDAFIHGYQGYLVSRDVNIHLCHTRYEHKQGMTPDKIFVIGKELIQSVKRFDDTLEVDVAPAFRFKHVWNRPLEKEVNGDFKIFLPLPLLEEEVMEILSLVSESLLDLGGKVKVEAKIHPAFDREKFLNLELPININYVSSDVYENLRSTDLVIGNTTSVIVEALAMGIPVLIVGSRRGFTQNPIPENISTEMWKLCFSKKSLIENILHYMESQLKNSDRYLSLGNKYREGIFERSTVESVQNLLKI
jgi:hypothetical protein